MVIYRVGDKGHKRLADWGFAKWGTRSCIPQAFSSRRVVFVARTTGTTNKDERDETQNYESCYTANYTSNDNANWGS